jgi:putative PEP-CTERM system histidine kinase
LVVLALVLAVIEWVAGEHARYIEISVVFALLVVALAMMPSARVRAWVKVEIAKHFFQHRYDYRTEWMRFADMVGRPPEGGASFDDRIIRAVADITDSPSGLLLLADDNGLLALQARWNWMSIAVPSDPVDAELAGLIEREAWIIDLDAARRGITLHDVPEWMLSDASAWALVPLIHFGKLAGAILLSRPREDRALDWEDLDMLRMVGRQVSSYIREAQGQQALADAHRFEEFNRRFAFIMHDIKNLVSQLALLARNAERHAHNPEFRADMLLSLRESVGRMNELLARLSQHNSSKVDPPVAVAARPVVERAIRSRAQGRAIEIIGEAPQAFADPARLEQIVRHLVQNAVDASDAGGLVTIQLGSSDGFATVEVIDHGVGMSSEFIRSELFKPFASTKPGGFGIGAFEARELARAMNGRLEVRSRLGEGSCFTLSLPLARSEQRERAA